MTDSTRVYIGNVSSQTRESDLRSDFERYGRVVAVNMKRGFAFVEFDDHYDAKDAIRDMDGQDVDGRRISCEFAKGARRGGGRGGSGYRVTVEGLDARTSWQDLKDFGREAGEPEYSDVWTDRGVKMGVVEYRHRDDFENALDKLDGRNLDGAVVRVYAENNGGGGRGGGRRRSPSPRRRSISPRRRSISPHRRPPERRRSPAPRRRSLRRSRSRSRDRRR